MCAFTLPSSAFAFLIEMVFSFKSLFAIWSLSPQRFHYYFVLSIVKIPAKKWGDTEIAERGRSVLVMRARYRSAGLTPHQRGWTDAG